MSGVDDPYEFMLIYPTRYGGEVAIHISEHSAFTRYTVAAELRSIADELEDQSPPWSPSQYPAVLSHTVLFPPTPKRRRRWWRR